MIQKLKIVASLGYFLLLTIIFIGCKSNKGDNKIEEARINNTLDSFNIAAAKADYNSYFNYFTDDATFIGTDATERWDKKTFMAWAKPHFDRGKAWNFTSIVRHIYFDKSGNTAWFDELLNTQMKICRGSGVLIKQDTTWKIAQYVLSITVPNSKLDPTIKTKALIEDSIINKLTKK
jgi:hypothetical protein